MLAIAKKVEPLSLLISTVASTALVPSMFANNIESILTAVYAGTSIIVVLFVSDKLPIAFLGVIVAIFTRFGVAIFYSPYRLIPENHG